MKKHSCTWTAINNTHCGKRVTCVRYEHASLPDSTVSNSNALDKPRSAHCLVFLTELRSLRAPLLDSFGKGNCLSSEALIPPPPLQTAPHKLPYEKLLDNQLLHDPEIQARAFLQISTETASLFHRSKKGFSRPSLLM